MYSKQEAAQLRQEFWTVFGQYMAPLLSAEGEKINWVNYKTGEKDIAFRMQADIKKATVIILLTHKDQEIQQIYFEQFQQLENIFLSSVGNDWQWQLHTHDDYGRTVSTIFIGKEGLSIFRKEDWPALISFFKENIIALDRFWSQVRYGFESLR
ncbi:MAG TPA: DUF4268 domain-containing protein [Flavisolibacter sp.]|jgi:hypothetical protein|nr:DUF4268 domain-containing protein [Flavisolibacter sp.]